MKTRPRWLWLIAGLLVLVLASGCGDDGDTADGNGADQREPTPAPTGAEGVELLIVEQNILHGIRDEDPQAQPFDRFPERIQLIAAALGELQPDVTLLQEVVVGGVEGYVEVRDILLGALGPEYTAVFGDITGGPIDSGTLGQMTLTRLPILSSENHFVGGVRSVHRVTVQTEAGPVDLYNAHLEGTEPDPQAAIDEIENALAFIEETRSGASPVIFAGDFNAEPADPSIQAVLAAGFVDALAAAGDPTCVEAGDPGCTNSTIPLGDNAEHLSDQRIDYIFVLPDEEPSAELREASLFLDQPVPLGEGRLLWASDHIGVRAVVELDER